jgi:hypothetical protein
MGFVRYLTPDLHDGHVLSVERDGSDVRVVAKSYTEEVFEIVFSDVDDLATSDEPAGMELYALAEMEAEAPLRRFLFINWDEEEDPRRLEIVARSFTARQLPAGERG